MRIYLVVIFVLINFAYGENPGVAIRINKSGFAEASKYVEKVLKTMKFPNIPDITTSSADIKNIKITSFNPGKISLITSAPNIVTLSVEKAKVHATAEWSYKLSWFFGSKFSGDASVTLEGIILNQTVYVDSPVNGRPMFTAGPCSFRITTLDIQLANVGSWKWLIDPIVNSLNGYIKNKITEKVCPSINKELKKYLSIGQSKYPVNVGLTELLIPLPDISINIGLTRIPGISDTGIAVYFNGRCFNSKVNPEQFFLFSPPSLPSFDQPEDMAETLISEYVFNTFFVSLWQINQYRIKFTEKQIKQYTNYTVNAATLATVIPLFNNYLYSKIIFAFEASSPFKINIHPSGISFSGNITLNVDALLPNQTKTTVLSLNLTVSSDVEFYVENNTFVWKLVHLSVVPVNTGMSAVDFDAYFNQYVEPLIKKHNVNALTKGFKIPTFFGLKIIDASIRNKQNALAIGGSITFVK